MVNKSRMWFMWALASFFYAYQYILRLLPNVTMGDLMVQFQIDAQIFGQLSGIYYIGYAVMHIPLGLWLDRIGPKYVLPVCMVLCGAGLLPFVYASNWFYPCLGRFLIGIGSSGAILGVFKIIRLCFDEKDFTKMLGFSVTIGLLGAIYGGWPVHWMLNNFGWENTFLGLGFVGIVFGLLTFIFVPVTTSKASGSIFTNIKSVFSNGQVLIICLLAGLMVGPLEGFADGWSAGFLQAVYGLSEDACAGLPTLIFIGMGFGSPLLSMIAQKKSLYFQTIAATAFVMGLCFVLLLSGKMPPISLSALFFLIGFCCAYQILAIYKAGLAAKPEVVGLTTAVANMIIMLFGYIFHAGIGQVMTMVWDGHEIDGVAQYSATHYVQALTLIPVMLAIGLVGYVLLAKREAK